MKFESGPFFMSFAMFSSVSEISALEFQICIAASTPKKPNLLTGKIPGLVNPEKKEYRPFYISIIRVLFERFPTLVITNQTYMNYMFEILRQSPRETEDDFEKANKCLAILPQEKVIFNL